SANQWALLRWNLDDYRDQQSTGAGVLVLTTHSLQKGGNYIAAYGEDLGIEFDKIRVFEIFGGKADWDQNRVTFDSFANGEPLEKLFNSQMIFDAELNP